MKYIKRFELKEENTIYDKLFIACRFGDNDNAISIIRDNPDMDLNYQNSGGQTFLMYACNAEFKGPDAEDINNYLIIIEELLNHNVNVNLQSNNIGHTALMDTVIKGNKEIVNMLLSVKDIDLNLRSYSINFGKKKELYTALFMALSKHDKEIFDILLEAGADVNIGNPLVFASFYTQKQYYFINKLIEAGADWNQLDENGNDFLHHLSSSAIEDIKNKYPDKYKKYLRVIQAKKFKII